MLSVETLSDKQEKPVKLAANATCDLCFCTLAFIIKLIGLYFQTSQSAWLCTSVPKVIYMHVLNRNKHYCYVLIYQCILINCHIVWKHFCLMPHALRHMLWKLWLKLGTSQKVFHKLMTSIYGELEYLKCSLKIAHQLILGFLPTGDK